MERYYTDKGFISKGATLNVKDANDGKYFMLLPVVDMPETKGAPSTQAKTVLSDGSVTEVEGLQTNDQKTYTFNYHRDNLRQLNKYVGKPLEFIERNPDNTGEAFTGTLKYGRSALAVDGIVQGQLFLTVNSAEETPIDDVRSDSKYQIKQTAIITTPLPDVEVIGTGTYTIKLETSPNATIVATSEATDICTVKIEDNTLTITGVAAGYTLVDLTTSASGEATSYRTIAVTVTAATTGD